MFPNKIRAALKALGGSLTDGSGEPPPRITVIFMVAIAIQKFQQFESNKYKKSLSYDFDKEAALKELTSLSAADEDFYLQHFVKLTYFIRKFHLTAPDFSSLKGGPIVLKIMRHLRNNLDCNKASDQRRLYFLCVSLKFLTQNSNCNANLQDACMIVDLCKRCKSPAIFNELVSLLMHWFQKEDPSVGNTNSQLLLSILDLPHLVPDARAFFLGKMERNQLSDQSFEGKTYKSMSIPKVKKNQQVVSKTIQTVKSKQESKSSEEADFQFLKLTNSMKNRNRKQNCNTVLTDDLENINKDGDDRSIWRNTWQEVTNLYSLVSRGEVLKVGDKDEYLPSKLFGTHIFFGANRKSGRIYSLFINRMCVSMFQKLSRRQELNSQAIDKLMKCITDFQSMVPFLNLEDDFVRMFVDIVFNEYWDVKEVKDPDMAFSLFQKIMNETTEEYVEEGWVYNSTKVRRKAYNQDTIRKEIVAEINNLKLDAVKAIYNSAVRDKKILTKDRLGKITSYAQHQGNDLHAEPAYIDHVIKLIELAETVKNFDYKTTFQMYLSHLESGKSLERCLLEAILRFMINQARDMKRSRELFSDDILARLIHCLKEKSNFSDRQRTEIIEVINTYLEHETTEALSSKNLENLLSICFDHHNQTALMKPSLTSLLLSTNKTQSLSQKSLTSLESIFYEMAPSGEYSSFVVFILSRVFCVEQLDSQKPFLTNSGFVEVISSKLFSNQVVKLDNEDGERVIFKSQSEGDASEGDANQIAFLTSKIIWRSVENRVILSSATIDKLILVLTGSSVKEDKQLKIIAAKCLHSLTKYMQFGGDHLNQLLELINSPIYDVSIYIQAAYLKGCAKVAFAPLPSLLDGIHLENISTLFVTDSLKLGTDDYEEEINQSLFKTLLYEARKQEFGDNNLFLLFDNILNLNGKYAPQVLAILVAYTCKYTVPEGTVRTLENLLTVASYFDKALIILENIIRNGHLSVTKKTLNVFTENLKSSTNSRLRFYSFKLLEQASQNQELSDEVFYQSELVRAGYALGFSETSDKQKIIQCIQQLVDQGMPLPIDTREALQKAIQDEGVLRIFATASQNKQIIDQHLLDAFAQLFDPENPAKGKINNLLITIFENSAKNNQNLTEELLVKLEVALCKHGLEIALPVFIFLAQKGEVLSHDVIKKLLDKLVREEDPVCKQELLSSLGSLIEANPGEMIGLHLSKMNFILIRELKSDNHNIQKLCIHAASKLFRITRHVDDQLLEDLVQVGTNWNANNTAIRHEIKALFDSVIEDSFNPSIIKKGYRARIQIANLRFTSPENLLEQLHCYVKLEGGFVPQNYKQIKDILEIGSMKIQEEALNLLHNCNFKSGMTDEFLETVAILHESTMSDTLKNSCLQLLNEAVDEGKMLTGRAGKLWQSKSNQDEYARKFIRSKICQEIKKDLQLKEKVILDLLHLIPDAEELTVVQDLDHFIQIIIQEDCDYWNSQSFVLLIQQCIFQKRVLETALPCYCWIMKKTKSCNVDCLEALVKHFISTNADSEYLEMLLFETMYFVSKFTVLSYACFLFALHNLNNINGTIRGYSFGILRTSKHEGVKKVFQSWCDPVLESLAQNWNVKLEKGKDLDLVEILATVQFLDYEVLCTKGREVWKRELLTSDIFEKSKFFHMDQVEFYAQWLVIENNFGYQKSCKILSLMQKCQFEGLTQIKKMIRMIADLSFPDAEHFLLLHGPSEAYAGFKHDWCIAKLQACLLSKNNGINIKYVKRLADKLCASFEVEDIRKLFDCLKSIDNLFAFEDFISFCVQERISLESILDLQDLHLNDLRQLIEAKHLCRNGTFSPRNKSEEDKFVLLFQNLKKSGWSFVYLRELMTTFGSRFDNFLHLLQFLSTVHAYGLSSSNLETCQQLLMESGSFESAIQKINKLIIENNFQQEGKVKGLNELRDELVETNPSNFELQNFIKAGLLDIRKHIFEEQQDKLSWNEKQIQLWAKGVKRDKKVFSNYEAIAIIYRANFLITGHRLTDTQILCCLVALRTVSLKGKLLEVATGEGKSTIICILAIIDALRGRKVNVVTSSPVLAERDAKQKAKLYRMFSLTCADNGDKTAYLKGRKDCYLADIVYGEMSQFQFDILRDNYSKLGTLGGHEFMTAIVDEVDSMLIDDSSKIARLSSTVPGMDHLQAIYVFIWQQLISIKEKFIMFNNQMYFVNGKVGFEQEKIILEVAGNDGQVMKIPDLESYILTTGKESAVSEAVDDIDEYLRETLGQYLDSQMKSKTLYIPSNFADFVEKQKPKWIANAVEALNYQENIHYVIQDEEIRPVDYYSTGIVQSSTSWSDGLHQFLQLKHNLKMTNEMLTTNFLSNIGFMSKYDQVYGLTGTLGSLTARSVLKAVYKVELINIPQQRQKQYLELASVVAEDESKWLNAIMGNIALEIKKKRGILVICETIEHANRISGMLKRDLRSSAVKSYTMNNMDQEKNVEKIQPGEVFIATNLAGRGTDIQTDKIEETGGLHVILTFVPSNQRVEDQAFGRTARQGKRGTGLMILNARNLIGYSTDIQVKVERDRMESSQLMDFQKKELGLIQVKDKLFDKFCSFLNDEIRLEIRKKENIGCRRIRGWFTDLLPTTYETCMLAAIEEQWAGFLSKLDAGIVKCIDAEVECDRLIDELRDDFRNEKLIKNPYYYISIGNDILVNEWSFKQSEKISRAHAYFKKAIQLEEEHKKFLNKGKLSSTAGNERTENLADEELQHSGASDEHESVYCPGAAHSGVAWCLTLLQKGENYSYKGEVLLSLKRSLNCLVNEMSVLNATQLLLEEKQPGYPNSSLYKQLNMKATILGSYIRGVNSCIDAIKRSKRIMDVVSVQEHHKKSKGSRNTLRTIKHFNELERNDKEKCEFLDKTVELSSSMNSLIFNYLTTREDSGTKDQALMTLSNAFDGTLLQSSDSQKSKLGSAKDKLFSSGDLKCLPADYKDIGISLIDVNLARIDQDIFNPDKDYKDLTREMAIAKLKHERTYWHAACKYLNSSKASLKITSTDERKINKDFQDREINELIGIVEGQALSDITLRFHILIKRGNENGINHMFRTTDEKSIELKVCFDNLEKSDAIAKVKSIKAESADVKFVTSRSVLLNLIMDEEQLKSGMLCTRGNQLLEEVDRHKLLKILGELKSDETQCFIQFNNISLGHAESIINKSCKEVVTFAISFNNVHDFYGSNLKEGSVNFCFEKLNKANAKTVIELLRVKRFEFSLQFHGLSNSQLRLILKHATLEQEHMKITKVKNISDLFMVHSLPKLELNEFASKGLEYIIEMNEELFIPWRSVCIVSALAAGQVLVGGALMITGFGGPVGMALVTEGISDSFVAFRAYSSRQFQWNDYCLQKSVSLALSVGTMGFSKWKDAAKGIETVTTGVGKEALEQAATQVITNKQAVAATLRATGQNLKSLTCKVVGTKVAEAVTREALNAGIKSLSNLCFESLKPDICQSVQSYVRRSFDNPELKGFLYKMYAIDLATNSNQLQSRVEQIVAETINPRHDFMKKMWDSIGLPLIKGVLSDSGRYASTASMGIRIIGTLNGLKEVLTLTEAVVKALTNKLRSVDRSCMRIALVLHTHLKIDKEKAEVIAKEFKRLQIFDEFDQFSKSDHEHVGAIIADLSCRWKKKPELVVEEWAVERNDIKKSIRFLKQFHEAFCNIEMDSFNTIMKSVSDEIAQQLIRTMDSQLLQPWSTLAVSSLTDSLSKRIQHHLVNEEENSGSQKADQEMYDELSKKENLTAEDKAFMASYGKFRTFTQQYTYNSRDYCVAYSQSEIAYYAGRRDKGSDSGKAVSETANGVRNGYPANLATMMAVAKINGVNLKLVDNKDYVMTEEDKANGVQIVFVEHGEKNGIGHAYYMDSSIGQFVEAKSSGFDCFYAAFSKILETHGISKTVADLRSQAAQHMETNSENFSKVVAAENWIKRTHPDSSNNLLFTTGLRKEGIRLILEDGDVEKLIKDINETSSRGGTYKKDYKKLVPENAGEGTIELNTEGGAPSGTNVSTNETVHHIISNQQLEKCVVDSFEWDREGFSKVFEDYINREPVKKVIEKQLIDSTTGELKKDADVGKGLHASLTWNPNNLAKGPGPKYRANDPGSATDKEILGQQTQEYQETVKKIERNDPVTNVQEPINPLERFKNFTILSTPEPISWEITKPENKYKQLGVKKKEPPQDGNGN